jgi:tetratricopeptide (TPR) repeat protein
MTYLRACLLLLCLVFAVSGISEEAKMAHSTAKAVLIQGMGTLHHPVTTTVPEAQKFFDQGLTLIYAFNHGEAIRSFQRAAELDPHLAMAHWGIALATGPNYNEKEIVADREKKAYEAIQKAISLQDGAGQAEQDYIRTLAKRFSADPNADQKKLADEYRDACRELSKKYPEDLDAAILYVESIMTPIAWKLYSKDGKPAEGTEEATSILEWILRRDPNHIGANHYYIHATETSRNPERAIPSAERLTHLVPSAGHLIHMPAHVFERVGEYEKAVEANRAAARVDETLLRKQPDQRMYRVMYYDHNIHFISYAASIEGRYAEAIQNAEKLYADIGPLVKEIPWTEAFLFARIFVPVQFQKWNDVLNLLEPPATAKFTTAMWHWARAMAFSSTGKETDAFNEQKLFMDMTKSLSPDYVVGFNKASDLAAVAENLLDARLALAKENRKSAIESLRKAVAAEDALIYDEPPDWFCPVRPTLGAVLIADGENQEAEKIFREDLELHPRNGRSLFGLLQILKTQERTTEASFVEEALKEAWKNADTKLKLESL